VSLQWEPPHGAYPAEGYVVDWVSDMQRLDGRPPAATGSSKGATQRTVLEAHALIGGLQPGTGYVVWVAARNAAGIGAWGPPTLTLALTLTLTPTLTLTLTLALTLTLT